MMLAGGRATRLGGLAAGVPKILVEVAGRPFAEHQLDRLRSQGVSRVIYCIGHLGEQVRRALGDGSRWGMRFEYVEDGPRPAGTGGAVRLARSRVDGPFFVMYGDAYLDCPLDELQRAFLASGQPALMTVFRNENRWDASNVRFRAGRIEAYDKERRTPEMQHIDYGCGVLTPRIFDEYPDDEPLDLARVYGDLVSQGRLAGFEVFQRFYEIGTPAGLEETRAWLTRSGGVPPSGPSSELQ
jgi:NDP-sugar pyrophosphorylase family protein